jgi:hypothetical protein
LSTADGMIEKQAMERFFVDLFGDEVCEASRLVIFSTQSKRTTWAKSIPEAVDAAAEIASVSDAYFNVCLQGQTSALIERRKRKGDQGVTPQGMAYARGYATTVSVIPGLWLDLDIAGAGHQKPGLPSSAQDAWKIIEALPFSPTMTLRTGGGFHAYWLFKEPWIIESQEERDKAAGVIRGWQHLAIDAGSAMGFAVDSTHDLVRCLRPEGTINFKYDSTVRQYEEGGSPNRYNPSDFDDWCVAVSPPPSQNKIDQLVEQIQPHLTPHAQPPAEKLLMLLNTQPQFAATWNNQRDSKWSQSEYDMSLANMASNAGWSPEEISTLIIAHRRQNCQQLKIERPRYYGLLLVKSEEIRVVAEAQERIEDRVASIQQQDTTPDQERDGILNDLSSLLGFPIKRIIKYLSDPPQYRLVLNEGTIHLGEVNTILNPAKFRAAIAAVSGTLISRFNATQWDQVAQAILQAVEVQDLGADSSAEALVSEWLLEFMNQHPAQMERSDAIACRSPFVLERSGEPDRISIFLSEFRSWLAFHRDERLGRRQLATLLRAANCEPCVVKYSRESDGHPSTVHVWLLSPSFSRSLYRGEKTKSQSQDAFHG